MPKKSSILRELQTFDTKIIKEKNLIEKIPENIVKYEQYFHLIMKECEEKKKELNAAVKVRKEHETHLDEVMDRIRKLKERIPGIKTNKEYQLHLKEIESVEKQKNAVEDDILIGMDRVDEIEKGLNQLEERLKIEETKVKEKMALLKKEQDEAHKELGQLLVRRNTLSSSLETEIYKQYMNLIENKNALAVVRVKDEICMGCNMSIPPQTYAEVIKNENLLKCPQCGRFLYYDPELKEETPIT